MPTTDTKEKILEFIRSYPLKRGSTDVRDISPTLDEIAEKFGITKGTVQYHLEALKKEGLVDWTPRITRTLRAL